MGQRQRSMADRSSAARCHIARAHGLADCKSRVMASFRKSKLPDKTVNLPRFDIPELELGPVLGKGQFGTISEVRAFQNKQETGKVKRSYGFSTSSSSLSDDDHDLDNPYYYDEGNSPIQDKERNNKDDNIQKQGRIFMARTALQHDTGRARFAVKVLSPDVAADTDTFLQAINDMAMETRILSNMDHPNIMKLRAHARVEPYSEYYFIVMDRLYDSLEDRLAQWEKRATTSMGNTMRKVVRRMSLTKTKQPAMTTTSTSLQQTLVLQEKLQVAYDLADALCYVHKMNIVYRDIKSENVGFDIRNDVRLFDFGLCKDLSACQKDADGTYALTQLGVGLEGNPKYIAPEVATGQRYNKLCDSFGFAVLIWQIFACQTPHMKCETPDGTHILECYRQLVWEESVQQRPVINENWPLPIRLLLKRGWTHRWEERSSMDSMREILRQELVAVKDGDETSLDHLRRRSTYIFDPESCTDDIPKDKPRRSSQRSQRRPSLQESLSSNRRASLTMKTAYNARLSERSLKVDPRDQMANLRQDSSRSIGSTMSAAEVREEKFQSFCKSFANQGNNKTDESAERQIRRSSIGSVGPSAQGGLELPPGVAAADDMEDFADAVLVVNRETLVQGRMERRGSCGSVSSIGSNLSLRRHDSSKSLVESKKGSKSKKRRSKKSDGASTDESADEAIRRQKLTRSHRKEGSARSSLRRSRSTTSLYSQESRSGRRSRSKEIDDSDDLSGDSTHSGGSRSVSKGPKRRGSRRREQSKEPRRQSSSRSLNKRSTESKELSRSLRKEKSSRSIHKRKDADEFAQSLQRCNDLSQSQHSRDSKEHSRSSLHKQSSSRSLRRRDSHGPSRSLTSGRKESDELRRQSSSRSLRKLGSSHDID